VNREISVLARISTIINSSLDIAEILGNSMTLVEELLSAEACSIFELDPEKEELFFRLARFDPEGRAQDIRIRLGEGIAGHVASTGEMVVVPDTGSDARFQSRVDALTGFRTDSIIALPIPNKGRITGVLQVLNSKKIETLDGGELEFLSVVAGQIGVALENARLYGRLQEQFVLTRDELKTTQAQLIRSERLAAMGELCQGIAHEVRNPVMCIGGLTKRLKTALPPDDNAVRYADIIIQEAARLEKMVRDVECFTSLPDPEPGEVLLSELVREALDEWKARHQPLDIEVAIELPDEDPVLSVDRDLIRTALVNIFVNAQESMTGGGTVTVTTWCEEKWRIVSVRDSGAGIARADLPHVFEPFYTSKTRGSGLGLTAVHRIATGHGGEVKIYSTPGVGTDVRICLPFSANEEPPG